MTWSDFYLICFAVGFCFSFFSFVFGGSRFGKLHLPHFHGHGRALAGGARTGGRPFAAGQRLAHGSEWRTMPGMIHHGATCFAIQSAVDWRRSWRGLAARDIC